MFEVGHRPAARIETQDTVLQSFPHDIQNPRAGKVLAARALARHRPRWLGRPKAAWLLGGACVLGLAIGAALEAAPRGVPMPKFDRIARLAGFGVDQITLRGHHFTFDREIFDALDLANVQTFAALDTAVVKARIERLPWIATAELTRVYPGRLDIRVAERKPYALWSRSDRHYLIDETGRVLAAVGGSSLPDLPRVAGEGAAADAKGFLATVSRYPEIASRLAEAERVAERRWRLKLTNGATLELPADGEVAALEELARDPALGRLVAAGGSTFDFRGPGRVAIRANAPVGAPQTSNTGS